MLITTIIFGILWTLIGTFFLYLIAIGLGNIGQQLIEIVNILPSLMKFEEREKQISAQMDQINKMLPQVGFTEAKPKKLELVKDNILKFPLDKE